MIAAEYPCSYSIPTVTDRYGQAELELHKKRRDGFLAAISREDLDMTSLHKYKVCEKHFYSWQAGVSLQYNGP